jgi:hypothetical protein
MRRKRHPASPPPAEILPPERRFDRRELLSGPVAAGAVVQARSRQAATATALNYAKNPRLSLMEHKKSL